MARNRTSQADYGALLADRDEEVSPSELTVRHPTILT